MKKLIALMTISAMLAAGGAVFAEGEEILDGTIDEVQGDIMLINEPGTELPVSDDAADAITSSYIYKDVVVTEVKDDMLSTVLAGTDDAAAVKNDDEKIAAQENVVNYIVSDQTLVFSKASGDAETLKDIKAGDQIGVYTGAYEPVVLMLPPQLKANIIVVYDNLELDSLRMTDADTYLDKDGVLTNAANTLALNIDDSTEVVDMTGEKAAAAELARKDLLVFYGNSTRSIPAQTTPTKIVVLGENEIALANIDAAAEAAPQPEVTPAPEETAAPSANVTEIKVGDKSLTNMYKKGNVVMVPLREIAETLGFTVDWDGDLRAVTLNGGIYSLKIGENSYVKGKMAPIELDAAPEITNDLTYVPANYFAEVLECGMAETGAVMAITAPEVQNAE